MERGQRGRQGTQAGILTLHPSWHRGKAWSDDTSQLGPDKHARDVPSLDKYAEERWEVRTWESVCLCLCSYFLQILEASLLSLLFHRWSCTSWWALLVQLSARTWLSSSARLGS